MKENETIDKTMVTRAVISKIKEENKPDNIKASHLKDFESPSKISYKGKEKQQYMPDIVATYNNGINVYEIELEDDLQPEKWSLMSLYAKKNHGNFYLVVPDYKRDIIKKMIIDKDINAGIIYFNT